MTLNVLFLAAEAEPFIKVGGLGDVAGALPEAIHNATQPSSGLPEVDIRLVIPYHYAIKERDFDTQLIGEFDVPKVDGSEKCQVYHYDKGAIPIYLLDGDPIDDKSPVYSIDPILDGYKFVFFSIAALELPHFLNWRVDILQANDWHTATSVYALTKKRFRKGPLKDTRTIHTLHNLPFMGLASSKRSLIMVCRRLMIPFCPNGPGTPHSRWACIPPTVSSPFRRTTQKKS